MTKMKEVHIIYVTTYGDDWEHTEKFIATTMDVVKYYKSDKYKKDQLTVCGIERIEVEVEENLSLKDLKDHLTVDEFCELFPEINTLIDNYFKGE